MKSLFIQLSDDVEISNLKNGALTLVLCSRVTYADLLIIIVNVNVLSFFLFFAA